MTVALILAGVALLFCALGGGFALGLHLFRPHIPRKKRIAWSAGLAALLPMIVPFAGFLTEGVDYGADGLNDLLLGSLALLSGTGIAAMVLCLPTAWWVTTRLERQDGGHDKLDGGDQGPAPLLENRSGQAENRSVTLDGSMEMQAG